MSKVEFVGALWDIPPESSLARMVAADETTFVVERYDGDNVKLVGIPGLYAKELFESTDEPAPQETIKVGPIGSQQRITVNEALTYPDVNLVRPVTGRISTQALPAVNVKKQLPTAPNPAGLANYSIDDVMTALLTGSGVYMVGLQDAYVFDDWAETHFSTAARNLVKQVINGTLPPDAVDLVSGYTGSDEDDLADRDYLYDVMIDVFSDYNGGPHVIFDTVRMHIYAGVYDFTPQQFLAVLTAHALLTKAGCGAVTIDESEVVLSSKEHAVLLNNTKLMMAGST